MEEYQDVETAAVMVYICSSCGQIKILNLDKEDLDMISPDAEIRCEDCTKELLAQETLQLAFVL